ncbi:MAG: type I restriction endonuclease [Cytophagia bacterium]|nr:MAG: type I restriction endonuclease [Cytophagia bacterium]
MAQALFKEWCWVEEGIVPDGWSWKKLLEIADVSSSKRIFRDEYILKGVPFYRGKEVTQLSNGEAISTELFISEERYSEIKEKFGVPQIGDILITSVGTIGSVWLVDNDAPFYFKDGNVTWIKDYKTTINGEFVYQWLQTKEAKEQIKSVTIGSTQQALTISALRGLNILIPDTETVSNVCIQLEKINAKRINNLPKLMSGKISLNLDLLDSQDSKDLKNQANQVNLKNHGSDNLNGSDK